MSPVGRVTHRWGNDCGKIPGDRMVIFHRILHKGCNLRHFLSFFDSKSGVWAMRSKNASFLAQRFVFFDPSPGIGVFRSRLGYRSTSKVAFLRVLDDLTSVVSTKSCQR